MRKYLFLTLSYLLLICLTYANSQDSLLQRLEIVSGVEKIQTLRYLSEVLENEGFEPTIRVSEEAVSLSKELNDTNEIGLSLFNRGVVQDMFGRYSDAVESFMEAEDYLNKKGTISDQANNQYYLGMAYYHQGDFDKGLNLCRESLEMFQAANDSSGISENLNGIGLILQQQGKYQESTEAFFGALEYAQSGKKSHIIGNVGIVFLQIGELDKALHYFRQCYELEKAKGARVDMGYTLSYLGGIYFRKLNFDSAVYYFQEAYELNKEIENISEVQNSLLSLTRVYIQLEKPEKALTTINELEGIAYNERGRTMYLESAKFEVFQMLGQYDSANFYLQKTLDTAIIRKDWTVAFNDSRALAGNYGRMEMWKEAAETMKLHVAMKDSVYSAERNQIVLELSEKYEAEKKEAEILRLQIEEANARFRARSWTIGAIFITGLAGILILFQAMKNRKNREIRMEKLRTKIASDLHDEMGSILTGISMQAQMIKFSSGEQEEVYGDKIIANSQKAIDTMRDVIWSIDSRYDQIGGLVDRMKEHAFELLNPLEIQWDFNVDSWDLEQPMAPDVRQNLYLIFKEALNNIAKHAPKDRVQIILNQQKDEWTLDIQNWQKGEDTSIKENRPISIIGQGLKNMEMRAKQIGASFKLIREPRFQLIVSGKMFAG